MKTALRVLLTLLALAVFGWFVHRAGPAEIWRTCASLGWTAPLVLVPYAMVYLADTLGWRFAFVRSALKGIGLATLYRVRWCGEAVNNLLPSAYVGGEAVKVHLLRKRGLDAGAVTASVIVGRSLQTLTQTLFIALGSAAFLSLAPPNPGLQKGLLLVLGGSLGAVGALFWLQSQGLFSTVFRVFDWFGLRLVRMESRRANWQRVDERVREFYHHEKPRLAISAAAYLGGWFLDTLDILLVAWLAGQPLSWIQALAIEAFVGVAKVLGLFVPGAVGVQESGIALVCRLAGLPDTFGLSYAIIRRGREVVYTSIGWLLLYGEESSLKGISNRIAAEIPNE